MEVTLFLAISSILSLVAFVGLGPRLRNVRFTDSVRAVESDIQKNIADNQVGENKAGGYKCTPGGAAGFTVKSVDGGLSGTSGDCVLNGTFIFFDQADNSIKYQQVVSLRTKKDEHCQVEKAVDLNTCYRTRPLDTNNEKTAIVYQPINGLEQISGGGHYIVRASDPDTGKQYTLLWDGSAFVNTLKICYGLGGRTASLNFSNSSIEPKVIFDEKPEDCK